MPTDSGQAMTDEQFRKASVLLRRPNTSGVSIPFQKMLLAEVDRLHLDGFKRIAEYEVLRSRLAEADKVAAVARDYVVDGAADWKPLLQTVIDYDAYLRQRTEGE